MDKELENEIYELLEGFSKSMDFIYHYEDSDGNVVDYPKKETTKTCNCKKEYSAPKTEVKEDIESSTTIDALKKLLSEKYKEINDLKKKNKDLIMANEQDYFINKKVLDESKKHRNLLKKKVYADGYRLVAEIKSFIEFARECELFDDVNFTDPFRTMLKTLNDFNSIPGRLS